MSARLSLRDVTVRRGGRLVLDVPVLDLAAGEVLAVLGPNGAGKSTLLQVMALLERPVTGTVAVDGVRVRGPVLALRRRMAMVLQEPLLLDGSVRDNVALGLRLRGVPRGERQRRADRWLDRLGIAHLATRPAHALSSGEAQRAALARALALEPDVLLLDEPFSGLDAPARARLIADLAALLRETGQTAVLVTHDRDEALRLGDRVAVLIGGRLRQLGPTAEVFSHPADPEVAAFVGMETVVPGRVEETNEGLARVRVGSVLVEAAAAPVDGAVLLCLRPEDVVLAPPAAAEGPSSARNRLVGRVTAVTPAGGLERVELDCGFPLVALITRRTAEELDVRPGVQLLATFKASAAHLIPARPAPPATNAAG
jgi:tungstate transport system ATP-binding protein